MTDYMTLKSDFDATLDDALSGVYNDATEALRRMYAAALARAEAAEALARRNNDDAATAEAKVLGLEYENERLAARVAELEAAGQDWRDFTEHPPIGEPIQIVTVIDAVREEPDVLYRIGHTSEWQTWRPAPQNPTP